MKQFLIISLILLSSFCPSRGSAQSSTSSKESTNEAVFTKSELIRFMYKPLPDTLRLVRRDSKYGIINAKDDLVVPLIYDQISIDFSYLEDLLLLEIYRNEENELYYQYWEDGNESQEQYDELKAKQLADPMSILNLESKFQQAPYFVARKGDLWGVIDAQNEELIPFEYSNLEGIGRDLLSGKKDENTHVLNPDNSIVIPDCDSVFKPYFHSCLPIGSAFGAHAILIDNDKYGAINLFSREFILPKYDSLECCQCFPEGHLPCAFHPKDLCLNCTEGQRERNHPYKNVIRYKLGNKMGLLDIAHLKELTPASYDYIQLYGWRNEQIVQLDNEYTILMGEEKHFHEERFDSIGFLTNNYAVFKVFRGEKVGVLSPSGEYLLDLKWDDVTSVLWTSKKNCYIVKRKGKYGIVDDRSRIVRRIRYDSISFDSNRQPRPRCVYLGRNGIVVESVDILDLK